MINIPIYRAKKIDSDEYVEGYYFENTNWKLDYEKGDTKFLEHYICRGMPDTTSGTYKVDPTTLAIHFPDMLDSQGNKIFASLDRYYIKGADILENSNFLGDYSLQVAIYSEGCFYAQDKDGEQYNLCENWEKLKVIGIQE